ncbi:MAG TPA: polysaccharide deacetylase family protein [Candidatus Kryptonia bacterium]
MPILAYHKVDNKFEFGLTNVRPKSFVAQVNALVERDFRIVGSPENAQKNPKEICLTFDDAYDCFYRNVNPYLTLNKMKAVVFAISEYVGHSNDWDIRLSRRSFSHMTASQLREISELGFEVGSHTCTHRDLTALDAPALKNELVNSRKRLEDIVGRPVRYLSFPFGRHNAAVVAAAREAGYTGLFGLGSRVRPGVFERVPVYRIDTVASTSRKASLNRAEIFKSDLIHSFAYISAITSSWRTGKDS